MKILGLNAYHGDSSACLVVDGQLVAAVEEERFRRIKHWAGFPTQSIRYCLQAAGLSLKDIDHIAVNRDPRVHFLRKIFFALSEKPSLSAICDRLKNASKIKNIKEILREDNVAGGPYMHAKVHSVEHHRAHLASAFFVSEWDSAAVVSVDGFGDFASAMWGMGRGSRLAVRGQIYFPHSLGLFYLAMTQFLGFNHYGDEYKVMGLASYGQPTHMDKMRQILRLKGNGRFELDLNYFLHHSEGISMVWNDGSPKIGKVFSEKLTQLLGDARKPDELIESFHQDIAASAQALYEEVFFHFLNAVYEDTQSPNLCLAGGCAMNSVANGKIIERSKFKNVFVQAAATDAGGAIGAAYYVWHEVYGRPRSFVMDQAYWGPEYTLADISQELAAFNGDLSARGITVQKITEPAVLLDRTARAIGEGRVIGWFQGRMELGSRALGNRSILCDPRRADMKDILNRKIKRRESFRPFAPSILREKTSEWFETDADASFMSFVFQIHPEKRGLIPAVTHVDGSGRLQTVTRSQNPLYYNLIQTFEKQTGVPILLNTSFNENEPIVCQPREAIECFLRNKMDVLVLGNVFIERAA